MQNKTSQGGFVVIIVVVLVVLLILLGIEIYDQSHGGYSVDPTDPHNYFHAVIHNDLPTPVAVKWVNTCLGKDPQCNKQWSLQPGKTASDKPQRGLADQYKVETIDGHLLGCLSISKEQSQTHGTVDLNVSSHTACQ